MAKRKITDKQVVDIFALKDQGLSPGEIEQLFPLTKNQVCKALYGKGVGVRETGRPGDEPRCFKCPKCRSKCHGDGTVCISCNLKNRKPTVIRYRSVNGKGDRGKLVTKTVLL